MQNYVMAIAGGALVLFLAANMFVFDGFLETYGQEEEDGYVAVRLLSAPAQGGYRRFEAACAGCHGVGGQGTDKGPRLIDTAHAGDFREAKAFHGAVGRSIPEHRTFLGPHPDFNDIELMGKFLRELRLQIARRDE